MRSLHASRAAVGLILGGALGCAGAPRLITPAAPPVAACRIAQALPVGSLDSARPASPAPAAIAPRPVPGALVAESAGNLEAFITTRGQPSEAQWRALPPSADVTLRRLADDVEAHPVLRARAIAGLGVRARPEGAPWLARLLADPEEEPTVRRAAARALVYGFSEDPASRSALVDAARDPDATVRAAVARALRAHETSPWANEALASRRLIEEDPDVRAALGPP